MAHAFDLGPEHEGLSLEDRRQARKELLARYLMENPEEMRKAVKTLNTIARYSPKENVGEVVDRYKSDYAKVVGAVENVPETTTVDLPPIVKRTPNVRLDAMIERLKDLPPVYLEAKLQEIGVEFWKAGMPVTQDALRQVAAKYLNRRGVDRHYKQPIQATRT